MTLENICPSTVTEATKKIFALTCVFFPELKDVDSYNGFRSMIKSSGELPSITKLLTGLMSGEEERIE